MIFFPISTQDWYYINISVVMTGKTYPILSVLMIDISFLYRLSWLVPPVLSYQYSWMENDYCIRNHDWYLLSYPVSIHESYFISVWLHKASVCFLTSIISVLVTMTGTFYTILSALMSGIPSMYQYSWLVFHSCISSHNWYLLFNTISVMTGVSFLFQ